MRQLCVTVLSSLLVLVLAILPTACAQSEPPSPAEDWYPPPPANYSTLVPGSIKIDPLILDAYSRIRTEIYCFDKIFYLVFQSPFDKFFIYIYEWYPPGNTPSGHWILYAFGPLELDAKGYVIKCTLKPEADEPEGLHVLKCWLFNPDSGEWATGVVYFYYFKYPKVTIERVEGPGDTIVNKSYELNVYVKNLGEVDYNYTIEVSGPNVVVTPSRLTINVGAKSQTKVTFSFYSTKPGTASLTINLYVDGTILDSKTFVVNSKALKPGPMVIKDFGPKVLHEGEETDLIIELINGGEVEARQVSVKINATGFVFRDSIKSLSSISPGKSEVFTFTLKPVEGGSKIIQLQVTYNDAYGNAYTDTLSITLLVLVKLKVYAQDEDGNSLEVPLKVNGDNYKVFDRWIDPTESLRLEAPSEYYSANNMTKWIFMKWSDGSLSPLKSINNLTTSKVMCAIYKTQYYLNISTNYGVVVPTSGWYDAGTTLVIEASPPKATQGERYLWEGWRGYGKWSYTGKDNPATITIKGPIIQEACWKRQFYLAIKSDYGNPRGEGWYDEGAVATLSVEPTVGFLIKQVFVGWSGGLTETAPEAKIVMDGPKIVVANWRTDYTELVILILASTLIAPFTFYTYHIRRKKSRKQITPTPSTTTLEGRQSEREQIVNYLTKLEELYKCGRITEEVYLRLKKEYEEKLRRLNRSG